MKKFLGVLFTLAALLVFLFGSIYLFISGWWDILSNFDQLTFWQFVKDIIIIFGREVISLFVAGILGLIGYLLIK